MSEFMHLWVGGVLLLITWQVFLKHIPYHNKDYIGKKLAKLLRKLKW